MKLDKEIMDQYERAGVVLVPKGENREAVGALLAANGHPLPEFAGRCLHRPRRRQTVCAGA